MDEKEKVKEQIEEIESYYEKPLAEMVQALMGEPIVRHFKGTYYRVVGVGQSSEDESMQVIYTSLNRKEPFMWTRDLIEFLSPVPDNSADLNVTGQKRRFSFVDNYSLQLDIVPLELLLKELSRRDTDVLNIAKSSILETRYLVVRIEENEDGEKYVHSVLNSFPDFDEALAYYRKRKNSGKISENAVILTSVIYFDV